LVLGAFCIVSIFLLVFVLNNFTIGYSGSDSRSYIETAKLLTGQQYKEIIPYRLLKPAAPFVIGVLSFLMNMNTAFLLLNSVLYFLITILVFKIVVMLFNNQRHALISAVIFATSYPILEYGVTYMTDLPGWFFFVFSVYLTLHFLKRPSYWLSAFVGAVVAVGALTKETGALGGVFFVLSSLFLLEGGIGQRFRYVVVFFVVSIVPFAMWQVHVFNSIGYSYYDWYMRGEDYVANSFATLPRLPLLVKSIGGAFLLGWIVAVIGAIRLFLASRSNSAYKSLTLIILFLIISSSAFLLWPVPTSRFVFVGGLPLAILAGAAFFRYSLVDGGVRKVCTNRLLVYAGVALVVLCNILWFVYDDVLRVSLTKLFIS